MTPDDTTVAYPGREGAHTAAGADRLFPAARLISHAGHAVATVAPTTDAAAAGLVTEGDPAVVAIASARAAAIHGLVVIDDDIGDHISYTRFAAVAPYTRLDRRHGDWRVALTFETLHKAGALHAAITPLAERGIDMVQLVSRPIPS